VTGSKKVAADETELAEADADQLADARFLINPNAGELRSAGIVFDARSREWIPLRAARGDAPLRSPEREGPGR
jgi:hypothetical protein